MADIHAQIGRVHSPADPVSKAMAADKNLQDGNFDPNLYREPDYYIYIHSIADRPFLIAQPPLFPRLQIPAKKPGTKYIKVCRIPQPFNQVDREGAVGDLIVRGHQAERVAQSLCNPNNQTLDQDAVPPEKQVLGFGVDFNAQGVFWSKNEVPTDEEIKKAEARRERYYKGLIERARVLEISDPKHLEALINRDYHMAAEYFNIETSWHRKMIRYEECPHCGEMVKPGVAFHRNEFGGVCIIDEARARKAGVVAATVSTKKED